MKHRRIELPHLVFRVGITGARCIHFNRQDHLSGEVTRVLKLVQAKLEGLAAHPRVTAFYHHELRGNIRPVVRLISPLAKGADRIAANAALSLGMQLDVVMPFPQSVYEDDFNGFDQKNCPEEAYMPADQDKQEFLDLLKQASNTVMLDGARDDDSWPGGDQFARRSYEAVGHFVVRHCDLLIAIWDGKASRGTGGTQEIVEYAARAGVPVWWIHASEATPPVWIADKLDLRGPKKTALSKTLRAAEKYLEEHLERLIPAPDASQPEEKGLLARIAKFGQRKTDPVSEYFNERPRRSRWIWKAHGHFMKTIAKRRGNSKPKPPPVRRGFGCCKAVAYWSRWYDETSRHADAYSPRYRSAYTWVISLAALSVCAGAIIPLIEKLLPNYTWLSKYVWIFGVVEAIPLLIVVLLLGASLRFDWHRRSIEYRLLAELFRQDETLAALGWALPIGGVEHLADAEWLSWVAWLLAAVQRAAPFPPCELDKNGVSKVTIEPLRHLIESQIEYHTDRLEASRTQADWLERMGSALFLLLMTLAIVKIPLLALEPFTLQAGSLSVGVEAVKAGRAHALELFELLAAIFTSFSAAFLAIRSYAELRLLAEQSQTMVADLKRSLARLDPDRIATDRPLASRIIGEEAGAVASMMLRELEGWGRLFRGKLLEMP